MTTILLNLEFLLLTSVSLILKKNGKTAYEIMWNVDLKNEMEQEDVAE